MSFKDWLLWKAKSAGERSDLMHKQGLNFQATIEAGKEEAYREVANSKFVASHQAADEITLGEILQCPRCQKTGKAKIFRRVP